MKATTIYRINEKDCTINIAQSVADNEEDIHGAALNARTFSFDELLRQHISFNENTGILDTFRDRIHSCLRVSRSIEVATDDMIARFIAEHGENIFFRGFVDAVIEKYETERILLIKPADRMKMELKKKQIQNEISERINAFFDEQLKLVCSDAYFDSRKSIEYFAVKTLRSIIAADEYTFNVFHESDTALVTVLSEIGAIVHKNKWIQCECGFCHKVFLGAADEVCCKSEECRNAHEEQKKAVYKEFSAEYRVIKKDYDSYVRRYKKMLVDAKINIYHPAEFDEFELAKKDRMDDMSALMKRLIRNSLPVDELVERSEKYKAEIKALTEKILEKFRN